MKERQVTRKIAESLNFGVNRIEQDKLARLRTARENALAAAAAPRHVFGLAWAGGSSSGHGSHLPMWLPIMVLLIALAGAVGWQYSRNSNDVDDVDAALLAGDLPIHAYMDSGFQAWLEHSQ